MQEILNPENLLIAFPAIIVAVVQLVKQLGIENRWIPILNVVLGFMAFPVFSGAGFNWYYSAMGCFLLGLSAGGLFDLSAKTVLNK